jgi:hypothetical protein
LAPDHKKSVTYKTTPAELFTYANAHSRIVIEIETGFLDLDESIVAGYGQFDLDNLCYPWAPLAGNVDNIPATDWAEDPIGEAVETNTLGAVPTRAFGVG